MVMMVMVMMIFDDERIGLMRVLREGKRKGTVQLQASCNWGLMQSGEVTISSSTNTNDECMTVFCCVLCDLFFSFYAHSLTRSRDFEVASVVVVGGCCSGLLD